MNASEYLNFIPGVIPTRDQTDEDLWFIFSANKILVKIKDCGIEIPTKTDLLQLNLELNNGHFLGDLKDVSCYTISAAEIQNLPSSLEFKDFRMVGVMFEEEIFLLGGKASQILYWESTHKYCSRCGSKTVSLEGERAKKCPECGFVAYPKICPATITAVIKNDKILLAHNSNFAEGLYSVIAGFVEPGETFEECVRREVLEEVGIKVKNIKYFSSQPWPFPNSLMIAFTAEYESGEIKVDGAEISDANWFSINNLPMLPSKISVASKLINHFIESQKAKNRE